MDTRSKARRLGGASAVVSAVLVCAAVPAYADADADAARVKVLLKQLRNSRTKDAAVAELAKMGTPAVEGIVAAVLDKSTGLYATQAQTLLVAMGPGAIKDIIPLLTRREASIRKLALKTLGDFGPAAEPAVSKLVKILDAPDPTAQMGLRRYAAAALGSIGPAAAPGVHALAQSLEDREDFHGFLRMACVLALGKIGPAAKDAAVDLAKVLANDRYKAECRQAAARALGLIGQPPETVVPALRLALQENPNTLIAREAVVALGKAGPAAKDAVPDILAGLDTKAVGYRGLQALAAIGPGAKEAIGELIKRLADKNVPNRKYAAEALGRIGPEAKEAIPALVKAFRPLEDTDPFRVAIVVAIARLEGYPSRAVPFLKKCITSSTAEVSSAAFKALGELGENSRGAVPALVVMTEQSDRRPGGKPWQAIEALGNMGSVAKPALPYLIKIIQAREKPPRRSEKPIRLPAIEAIAKIAPTDRTVLAALKVAAESDPDPDAQRLAIRTLARVKAEAKPGSE